MSLDEKKDFASWEGRGKTEELARAKPQKCEKALCDQRIVSVKHLIHMKCEVLEEGRGER